MNMLDSKCKLLFQNLVDLIPHFKINTEKTICKAGRVLMIYF